MTWARRLSSFVVPAAVVALVGGCSGESTPQSSTSTRSNAKVCADTELPTTTDGRLTLATYEPVYAPWFVGNDPGNGQGFEAALGFRVAQQLGFRPADVVWVRQSFEQLIGPGATGYDLGLAEVSMTPTRAKNVDFTTSYAAVHQAVLTYEDSPIASKTTVAELRSATFGASVQTTSAQSIATTIKPTAAVQNFPSIKAAGEALADKKVDGLVADLPTATYLADSVLDDGVLLGQLPGPTENVAGVLPKGSKLKNCVNQALGKLRDDGTLEDLRTEWLADKPDRPILK